MKLLDADHPFFIPVWRRWVTVLAPLAWSVVEFRYNGPGWGVLFAGAGLYAFWILIVKGPGKSPD